VPWAATTEEGTPAFWQSSRKSVQFLSLEGLALPRNRQRDAFGRGILAIALQEDRVRYFIGGQRLEFLALVFVQLQEQADMRQVDLDALVESLRKEIRRATTPLENGIFSGTAPCSGTLPSRDRCQWSCSRGSPGWGAGRCGWLLRQCGTSRPSTEAGERKERVFA